MLIQKWQDRIKEKRAKYLASRPRPDQIKDYSEDEQFKSYLDKLYELRKDGVIKLDDINSQIREIKTNKQIKKEEKIKLITALKAEKEKAKAVKAQNKEEVKKLVKEAIALSKARLAKEYKSVKADDEIKKFEVKKKIAEKLAAAKDNHYKNLERIKNSTFKDKKERALEIQNENNAYEAIRSGLKIEQNDKIQQLKQDTYACYLSYDNYNRAVRNGKRTPGEQIVSKWQHFAANFDFLQFLTKYALYMIIILIFIILVIVSATKGVQLLSGGSILTCLRQIAPKIFFSLGAACLILLGGTDLSIGRLTGIGVSFTLMILSSTNYSDNNGVVWFATGGMSGFGRVILALLISIGFCTLFSTFSGFFTAKFKIHPFITTLATQLISYGLFQIFWSATSTFSPTDKDTGLMYALRGAQGWQLILYAVIAIAIVWFIWNKTKYGKNLYAVGGNQEAAKVSGINPFIITLLAFVMAGILYGCGGFVQAVQTGTGNFTTGYGTETDAIAACVIGGISFTGGVGKVSGAVIGTVVLGFLTFAFSSMGMDANLQLVIKGIIIILAVTLDCVKYIKKK